MKALYNDTPKAKMFTKGTILWRSCWHHNEGELEICDIKFKETDRGTFMARMHLVGGYIDEPQIHSYQMQDSETKGYVVFVNELPPDDWTHLIVSGVSKKLQEPENRSENGKGCAVFATVGDTYDMDDYILFRKEICDLISQDPNCEFDVSLRRALNCWPHGKRPGDCRLVYKPYGVYENGDWFPAFSHIVIPNPAKIATA